MAFINIAVASDQNYLLGALATLASARVALNKEVAMRVYFLHNGITALETKDIVNTLGKIEGEVCIRFINIDTSCFEGYPAFWENNSLLTYSRLLLPDILPKEINRIIYLDVDFLVMKSLAPLSLIELGSSGVGACIELMTPTIRHDLPPREIQEQANLNSPYLNAGLLVLDLTKLRNNKIFKRCMHLLAQSFAQEFKFHDQSALNYVLNGDFRILSKCWNIQLHRQTYPPSLLLNMIASTESNYHFVTSAKPWKWPSCSPPHEMFYTLLDSIQPGWKTKNNWNRKLFFQKLCWYFSQLIGLFYLVRANLRQTRGLSESDFKTALYWKQVHQDYNSYIKHKRTLVTMKLVYKQSIHSAV